MNWIERMYDITGKDPYSQNGEGIYLEYIWHNISFNSNGTFVDIGGGDGFYLSNIRHLENIGWKGNVIDKENGDFVKVDNIISKLSINPDIVSIDIDGNDYYILDKILIHHKPSIIVSEFNAAFTDSRTIEYNPNHEWDGTDYYGFSFYAGVKLAENNGYKVIFQNNDMNMYMVRNDLIKVTVPPVTFKQNDFFNKSNRTDWVFI